MGTPSPGVPKDIRRLVAWDRLASILKLGMLHYSKPFDTAWPIVSFTQSTRRALYGVNDLWV